MLYKWNILWQPERRCVERLPLSLSLSPPLLFGMFNWGLTMFVAKKHRIKKVVTLKFLAETASFNRKEKIKSCCSMRFFSLVVAIWKLKFCFAITSIKLIFEISWSLDTNHISALMYVWLKVLVKYSDNFYQ